MGPGQGTERSCGRGEAGHPPPAWGVSSQRSEEAVKAQLPPAPAQPQVLSGNTRREREP